jgi:hypothetical protein
MHCDLERKRPPSSRTKYGDWGRRGKDIFGPVHVGAALDLVTGFPAGIIGFGFVHAPVLLQHSQQKPTSNLIRFSA